MGTVRAELSRAERSRKGRSVPAGQRCFCLLWLLLTAVGDCHADEQPELDYIPGTCSFVLPCKRDIRLTTNQQSRTFHELVNYFYQAIRECDMIRADAIAAGRKNPAVLNAVYEHVRSQIFHMLPKPLSYLGFHLSDKGIEEYVAPLADGIAAMYIDDRVHGIDPEPTSSQ